MYNCFYLRYGRDLFTGGGPIVKKTGNEISLKKHGGNEHFQKQLGLGFIWMCMPYRAWDLFPGGIFSRILFL